MKKFLILLLLSLTMLSYSKSTNSSDITKIYDYLEVTRPVFSSEKAQKFADDYTEMVYGLSKISSQSKSGQVNSKSLDQYMRKLNDLNSRGSSVLNGLDSEDLQTMTDYMGEMILVMNGILIPN